MNKILSIILCISLIAACAAVFAACGKQNKEKENTGDTESGGEIDGGWTRAGSPVITDDFNKVFDKAVSEFDGVDYTPVAYLASQVVAGSNHCVLCKATPVVPDAKTTYAIVYVYEDLEGNAEITEIISSSADAQTAEGDIVGGWAETGSPEMTDDARKALEKACETLTGAEYTPVALLATQIVAGTNYRIVCESRPSVPSAERGYAIARIDVVGRRLSDLVFLPKDPEELEQPLAMSDLNVLGFDAQGRFLWAEKDGINAVMFPEDGVKRVRLIDYEDEGLDLTKYSASLLQDGKTLVYRRRTVSHPEETEQRDGESDEAHNARADGAAWMSRFIVLCPEE